MATFKITLQTPSGEHRFDCDEDDQILDVAEDHGVEDLEWGCRSGVCGACVSLLVSGTVDQESQMALDDERVAAGYTVLCVATPCSDVVIKTNPDD